MSAAKSCRRLLLLALLAVASVPGVAGAQGLYLQGVGTVNRAMAGVATAAPVDAAGAIYRNPATMSAFHCSEVSVGAELLLLTESVASTWPIGPVSGSTDGEPGATMIPSVGWVHQNKDSAVTYGLGMYGVAGFKANYPSSVSNPVLLPQPNGLGRVFAELQVFEVAPAVAVQLTPELSVGVSPILALGTLDATPLFLAAPDDANSDTSFTYRSGLGGRYHYGGAVQLGVYYDPQSSWAFGASIKSPTWFEDYRFFTTDEVGAPRLDKLALDMPMIISVGCSCNVTDGLLWALDARYVDYKNTDGFGAATYDAFGAATGLGWSNIASVATAVELDATERLKLRLGYSYQENPISETNTFFNVASPLILEHIISVGASLQVARNASLNVAYLHAFEAQQTGPFVLPGVGAVPGSSVTSTVSADALSAGFTVKY
ncbi:MAG: hydrocarbon degradation protein [Planctomycetaceae bacterium]|nr:hydrocarbon degradation protein [Planctomycetaceae bacterium]